MEQLSGGEAPGKEGQATRDSGIELQKVLHPCGRTSAASGDATEGTDHAQNPGHTLSGGTTSKHLRETCRKPKLDSAGPHKHGHRKRLSSMDTTKAFGAVNREPLWTIFLRLGCPHQLAGWLAH